MLDLKKLDKQADSLIEKITKDDYETWLLFDEERAKLAALLNGRMQFNNCQVYRNKNHFIPKGGGGNLITKNSIRNPLKRRVFCLLKFN